MGALLFLLPVLVGLWQVRTLRPLGRPWRHGQSILRQLAADAGVHRRVDVLLYQAVSGPLSCGVVRPTIVLPMDAQTWHEDDLGRAIVHELEHVRRGDWASQCLARAVCTCYWFHPLVWIAWRQLALEAERACDDAVLQRAEATAYADQLVVLAERLSTAPKRPLLAMANRTDLATRIVAVLDSRQQRGRAGMFSLALVCVAAALLVATISPLRVAAAAQIPAATQTFSGSLMDPLGRTLPDKRLTLRALAPADPDFAGATVDALRRWQFTAMRLDGVPVEMNIHVTANFVVQ
jgi:beta-lactamase regulating signal transducer with metallopeptidase domain